MMILIESKYELGQIVYLKTDSEQLKRIVKQICFSSKGMDYNLVNGIVSTWHSDFEITEEVNILTKTGVTEKI
jgi:hypothetical protein